MAFVLMFVLLSAVSQQLCDTYSDESLDCCGHDLQPLSAHVIGAFSVAMLTASKSDQPNASSPQRQEEARVAHETYLVRDLWRVAPKTSPPSRHT